MDATTNEQQPQDPQKLTLADLAKLRDELTRAPEEVLTFFREAMDSHISSTELRHFFDRTREILSDKHHLEAALQDRAQLAPVSDQLPAEFSFPGMDLNAIPIDPTSHKFEPDWDFFRWIYYCGPAVMTKVKKADFRRHDGYPSKFVYGLREPDTDRPLDIALFSDFGTGLYHSRYIAKQFATREIPYAIHCGDVYYAGNRNSASTCSNLSLQS